MGKVEAMIIAYLGSILTSNQTSKHLCKLAWGVVGADIGGL